MADTKINLRVNAQFDELAQLNAEAQRSRDKLAAMGQAAKILGKTVDNTDAAVEAHVKSLKALQQNLDRNSAEYKSAQRELDRYGAGLKKAQQDNSAFSDSLKGMAGAIVAAFSVDAITSFIGGLRDQALEARQSAAALGSTVEEVSKYQQLLRGTGVDMGTFTDLVVDMNEMLKQIGEGDYDEEVNKFDKGLVALGISSRDANGQLKSATQTFNEAAIQLSKMPDGVDKSRIAINLFKASNADAIPFINRVGKELQSTAAIMDDEFVDEVIKADQEVGKIGFELKRLAVQILPDLIDALKPLGRAVRDALKEFNKMPDWQQQGILIGGFAAVITVSLIPALASFAGAIKALNLAVVASPAAMAALGLKAGVVGAAVGATMILADAYSKASKVGEQIPVIRDENGRPVDASKLPGQPRSSIRNRLPLTPEQQQELNQLSVVGTGSQRPALQKRLVDLQNELVKLEGELKNVAITDVARQIELRERIKQKQLEIDEVTGAAQKRREQEAEQAAKRREQEAEKLARAQQEYDRDRFNLLEGYERDVAALRLDTLKQVQQLEKDLQTQRRDAEASLADAVLRRSRAVEDAALAMQLRSGKITQNEFDVRTEANRYERQAQDDILRFQQDRLNIQDQYLQNVEKINDLEMGHQEKLIELERKRVEGLNNAALKLTDQGGSVMSGKLMALNLSESQIKTLAEMGFTPATWNVYRQALANIESGGGNYGIIGGDQDLYDGAYQFGPDAKIDAARRLGVAVPSREVFRSNAKMQEDFLIKFTRANYGYLRSKIQNQSLQAQQEILAYAHNQGAGNTLNYLRTGRVGSDAFGTKGTRYREEFSKLLGSTSVSTTTGVPVSLSTAGVSQFQQIFALASNGTKFRQFSSALTSGLFDYSNAQFGQSASNPFANGLMYPNVSGFSPFQNPSVFSAGAVDFSRLQPYPGQIQGLGLQTAQMNLGTAQISNRFGYTTDLTNPRTGELAQMQQEFDLAMRRFQLEQQFSQVAVDRFLKIEEAARLEMQSLETANQTLQKQIESGTLDATALENRRSELTLNYEKLAQLQQLPQFVLQESQAQQQLLQQKMMERQLQADIANIISSNISQGIINLIQGSQSFGEVLNNVVLNILNQILQKLVEMVIQATIFQGIMAAIGGGGGGLFGGLFGGIGKLFGFANGGIMTADGTLPLSRYARGGIARSPQLAMFGEGSMPEAYVPLPDGRTIPVTIKGFANGGVYYPQRYNVFDDPFLNTFLTGMPDTALSRRYQEDDVLRQRMDSVFDEYVGTLYTILDDVGTGDVSSNHIQQLFARSVEDLVADNREFFDDTQFSDYLINRGIGEFFTNNENAYNLMQRSGAYDSENVGAFISNMQRQAFGIIRNQEQFEAGRRLGISGMLGDYYKQLEPTQNYFNDRVRDEQNTFFRMIRESAGIPLRGYQKPQRYARGGIARSPQLAMFGEGSMPEAYVPLPDGRTIPVSLMGGGGSNTTNNVSVSINANGLNQTSDSVNGAQLGRRIARAVQDEISRQQRPGGSLR